MIKSTLLYVALAVSNGDQAAKLMSEHGFTLKKPHYYKAGVQEGLQTQSLLFKDGTSLQLVYPKKKVGALAKWVNETLKSGEGGFQVVLETNEISTLASRWKGSLSLRTNPARLEKSPEYSWLSFKSDSLYAPLAFISWKKRPRFIADLFDHRNGVTGIKKVTIRPRGVASVLSEIMTTSGALQSRLDFQGLGSTGNAFVEKVILWTKVSPPPKSFKLGSTTFEFVTQNML